MSSASRSTDADADRLAERIRSAGLVRLVVPANGAATAGGGILAAALSAVDTPYHVRTRPDPMSGATRSLPAVDADDELLVAVGRDGGRPDGSADERVGADGDPAVGAAAVARALDVTPDPVGVLAGAVVDGTTAAADELLAAARDRGDIERRPGIAVPTRELAAGVAATTRLHAPFSGDGESTRATIAEFGVDPDADPTALDEEAGRRIASAVAVAVAADDDAPPRAAENVAAGLRPHVVPDGPIPTVEGYADLLAVVGCEAPGVALSLVLSGGGRDAALTRWRRRAGAAHRCARDAETARHAGFTVHEAGPVADDPSTAAATLRSAARICRAFQSREPIAAAVGRAAEDPETALVALSAVDAAPADAVSAAAAAVDGVGGGCDRTAWARVPESVADRFVAVLRGEL